VIRAAPSFNRLVQTGEELAAVARMLFAQFPLRQKIRLIGVSAGELQHEGEDPRQLSLFGRSADEKERLSHTVDEIKQKFGANALRRGSQLL